MELQHFSHEHLLTLCICKEGNDDVVGHGKKETCDACRKPISAEDGGSSSFYSCTQCNFFIHKFCAELPKKMINIFHPAHQLELAFFPDSNRYCGICEKGIIVGYYCATCKFFVHATCALQSTFEPQGHEHSFMLVKPTIFTCDVCGEEWEKCVSNLCTTCQLQVHKKCTSTTFPHTLKQMGHIHQLTLTYSFQLDFVDQPCKICFRKLKCELCVYYCSICPYIAHISCATSEYLKEQEPDKMWAFVMEDEEDDDENQERNPEVVVMSTHLSKDNNFIIGTTSTQLKHVSHEHCLILSKDETKRDEICDGCVRPVGGVPFYTCAEQEEECNFFLHKHCVELPNKILHPLHVHPLTLHAKNPWSIKLSERHRNDVGIFRCTGCNCACNGFIYACDYCKYFYLDVTCSLFSDTIQHKGHPCDLKPILGKENNTECDACGLKGEGKYRCEGCNFNLGLRCASLKDTTHECECPKHNCEIRPLKLTYKAEDDSGKYYCDVCEERRGQNHWFYYCEDCKFVSHLHCIHGKNSMKFGKSYQIEKRHPHSLTLLKEAKGNSTCVSCRKTCGTDPVLDCAECDIRMHMWNDCKG